MVFVGFILLTYHALTTSHKKKNMCTLNHVGQPKQKNRQWVEQWFCWTSLTNLHWFGTMINVVKSIINRPCLMVYSTYCWWCGGRFIIGLPTSVCFSWFVFWFVAVFWWLHAKKRQFGYLRFPKDVQQSQLEWLVNALPTGDFT